MKKLFAIMPLASALLVAADGKALYMSACKSCHGEDGTPKASLAKMLKVEMKHLGDSSVLAMSDAELKKAITDGFGKMKPVKSVSAADAGDVVKFMRTFKK